MATWPSRTWQVGELVTAGMMNSLRDELNELHTQVRPNDGLWANVPFLASNFQTWSGVGSWTVTPAQVFINRWTQIGKTVIWTCWVSGSTVTGTPTYLSIVPPVPYVQLAYDTCPFSALVTVTSGTTNGFVQTYFSGQLMILGQNAGLPYAAGGVSLLFTAIYETPTL